MGNPSYTPPEGAQGPAGQPEMVEGFRWRLDEPFGKVLLYGRDPLGEVSRNTWRGRKKIPWAATRHPGGYRSEKFVTEREAIEFVEASMPAYLEHRAYVAALRAGAVLGGGAWGVGRGEYLS